MAILETRNILTAIAGENITAGQYCFILHPDAPYTYIDGATAGRAYTTTKSIRHRSINANLAGFALDTVSAGSSVRILEEGQLSGFSGLVAGQCYQPANTAGTIEILENHRAALPSPIAQAISTTDLIVFRQSWNARGKGFCLGGYSTTYLNTLEAMPFATDVSAALSATLPSVQHQTAASSSGLKAYTGGGTTGSALNTVAGVLFSSEACTDIGDLTVARMALAGAASSIKSYWCNGLDGSLKNVIDVLPHAAEGNALNIGTSPIALYWTSGCSSTIKLYEGGGSNGVSGKDSISTMPFASEGNASSLAATLTTARYGMAAYTSCTKGYFAGGTESTSDLTTIDGLTFASETVTKVADMPSGMRYLAGTSTSMRGVMFGGSHSATVTRQETVHVYATDIVALLDSSALITARNGQGGSAS
jgi:hypothetical protein